MDREEFKNICESWEKLAESEKVCIYGTGDACEKLLEQFKLRGIKCDGIFASDDFVRDREFRGFKVKTLSELEAELGEFTVCCAFGTQIPEVMQRINDTAARHEFIYSDIPIVGEYFSKRGFLEHFDDFDEVWRKLADDKSRKVYEAVLKFKISGDPAVLREAFSAPAHEFETIIKPEFGSCYVDLGAYNGDTIQSFVKMCGKCGQIVAFEPDKRNFRKCVKRLIGYDNIYFINACAWSCDGLIPFSQSAGRQSKAGEGELTAARSLDSVLNGKRCDVIKIDVEGAEYQALKGAERTIKEYTPALAVSAYHRAYDLIDLPRLIWEIVPEYKLYIRQPPYYPAWDTMIYGVI